MAHLFESVCIRTWRQKRLHWFVAKKIEGESAYDGLAKLADDHDIELLVVGNIGRTQSKTESEER
jgi:nucleotide-binding universal stress UspA family protein